MSLTLIIGPMFSGKSKTLISHVREAKSEEKEVYVISHASDIRYSKNNIATHDNDLEPCESRTDLISAVDRLLDSRLHSIFIEEAQFFEDLYLFVKESIEHGKDVYVAGLQSDFRMKPFDNILSLIPLSDKIIHLTSECMHIGCRNRASFSRCLNRASCIENNIGGNEKYISTCRTHHSVPI